MQGSIFRSRHGFTLTELLVVMAIVVILTIAGIGTINRNREYQINADAIAFEMLSFINQSKLEGFLGKQQKDSVGANKPVGHTRVIIKRGPYADADIISNTFLRSLYKKFYYYEDATSQTGNVAADPNFKDGNTTSPIYSSTDYNSFAQIDFDSFDRNIIASCIEKIYTCSSGGSILETTDGDCSSSGTQMMSIVFSGDDIRFNPIATDSILWSTYTSGTADQFPNASQFSSAVKIYVHVSYQGQHRYIVLDRRTGIGITDRLQRPGVTESPDLEFRQLCDPSET